MLSPFVQGLLGGFSNLVEVMRGEGSPPTAVRAVVFGALCQLDAELLNQLLVRRDCCTMSAIKILQARRSGSRILQSIQSWLVPFKLLHRRGRLSLARVMPEACACLPPRVTSISMVSMECNVTSVKWS